MKTRLLLMGVAAAALLGSSAFAAPPSGAASASTAPGASSMDAAAPAAATKGAAAKPAAHSSNANLYRRAQLRLKDLNFYKGAVDGRRNVAFVRALERFQTQHHIAANGRLTTQTQTALGI